MASNEPVTEVMSRAGRGTTADSEAGNTKPRAWQSVLDQLGGGGWYWLASVTPDGRPHVMPLFAVWSESVLFVASNMTTRKSRNLAAKGACVVTADKGDLHLIVEGNARRVEEEPTLRRAAAAFDATYGWPLAVAGTELDAPYGAPTSGGPPYAVWEVTPTIAFGLPADGESFAPTRWRFAT